MIFGDLHFIECLGVVLKEKKSCSILWRSRLFCRDFYLCVSRRVCRHECELLTTGETHEMYNDCVLPTSY